MVGRNRSVFAELNRDAPSIVFIKRVCHSVQLAVNQACNEFLPDGLEFLIYKTYNWFCKSAIRQSEYKTVYQSINNEKVRVTFSTRYS